MIIIFDTEKQINSPRNFAISNDVVEIIFDPNTDFWQRSYLWVSKRQCPRTLG